MYGCTGVNLLCVHVEFDCLNTSVHSLVVTELVGRILRSKVYVDICGRIARETVRKRQRQDTGDKVSDIFKRICRKQCTRRRVDVDIDKSRYHILDEILIDIDGHTTHVRFDEVDSFLRRSAIVEFFEQIDENVRTLSAECCVTDSGTSSLIET